jgi:hypothetical protein
MTLCVRNIVAGQDVYDAYRARRLTALGMGPHDSEALCEFQKREARHGLVEAEIVKTIYGHSLRYASGLHDFGLIGRKLGTLEQATQFAVNWQAQDPERRFVSHGMKAKEPVEQSA